MPLDGQKTASSTGQEEQIIGSVFDFLYYDANRISSLLSQFDSFGHLTQITHTEEAYRHKATKTYGKLSGGAIVAKAESSMERNTSADYGQNSARIYDPRWSNALNFLDLADKHMLLQKDISNAHIGQLVLFSGHLSLFDMGILRGLWGLSSIKDAMREGAQETVSTPNRHERRKGNSTNKQAPKSEAEQTVNLATDLLSVLPHSIQSSITHNQLSAWYTLNEDYLTVSASDLFLKHGIIIDGVWNIIGILDAIPEQDEEEDPDTIKQMLAGVTLGGLATLFVPNLIPAVRPLMGRPTTSYGITPLLLFREVSKDR